MATIKWIGGIDTDSGTAANWSPASIPTAGDVALFNDEAGRNCAWTITTVDEIVIEDNYNFQVILNAQPTIKGMYLGGILSEGTSNSVLFQQGSAPNYFGSYKQYDERFLLLSDNASYVGNLIFSFVSSTSTPITKFDDGPHPTVRLNSGKFAPNYVTPTGTSGKASFVALSILASASFEPEGDFVDNDRLKVFDFTAFDGTAVNTVNFGLATAEFTASSAGVVLPTYNATGYSSTFQAYYRKIVLKANTHGDKILLADNTFISVEEFEIKDGCILKGPTALTAQGSDIRSIVVPKIRGSWSYSQISPGIYRSPRHASGPIDLINGNVHITGKLNVDGLIDPTGLELDPVSSNPGGVTANTLWLNSGDSDKLYFGASEVGGGGGGSGTVTSVATTAPITGGTITGTGTLGLDISALTANTAIADADLLLLDDGANGTNRKITFTTIKNWIKGYGVLVGRDGGVNELRIRDSRDDGDVHPNEFPDKTVSFDFTDDITGSPNSWDSVMTMKGWSDNYRAWQIFSSSASGSQSVDEVPLFFRSGEEDVQDGWGQTKEILTFPGTAPRVDGAANQILQTNGAGVLSWASLPATPPAPITGQYEKYILQNSVSALSGVTIQLSFGPTALLRTYNTGAITDWVEGPDYIEITADGLYQFTFGAFLATFGGSQNDMRQTISSNPGLTGDLLSFRNRTRITDRGTNTGTSTAFLVAGTRVYFSVFNGGQSWEVGGVLAGPEVRTFLDVRRLE